MESNIYCLVRRGDPLPAPVFTELFRGAQELMHSDRRKGEFREESLGFRGTIRTYYKLAMLAGICGFIFYAEYEWSGGSGELEYIVKLEDTSIFDKLKENRRWVSANQKLLCETEAWRN